jgi:hypothetical protein
MIIGSVLLAFAILAVMFVAFFLLVSWAFNRDGQFWRRGK